MGSTAYRVSKGWEIGRRKVYLRQWKYLKQRTWLRQNRLEFREQYQITEEPPYSICLGRIRNVTIGIRRLSAFVLRRVGLEK